MLGMPQEFWSVTLNGVPSFAVHILDAGQLLGDVVEQRVIAEPGFVHFGREQGPDVG